MYADEKLALCDARVTLNGEPAVIIMRRDRNPTTKVATLRSDGPVAEFAWETVAHIVADGGAFQS